MPRKMWPLVPRKHVWLSIGSRSIFYAISAQEKVAISAQEEVAMCAQEEVARGAKEKAWFPICFGSYSNQAKHITSQTSQANQGSEASQEN